MSKEKENFTLFVGDLSLFCNASHLKQAFSKFGEITAVRIAFDEQSQKQLHFGFVEFATYDSAVAALNAMNGTVLCGRILRVKWAINKNDNAPEEPKKVANFKADTSSIHVNFLSYQTSKLVSEELLRQIFSEFGEVKDVIIKKSTKDHNIQRGYGFVHYSNTAEGIQSTLNAIALMYDVTIDNVNFTCAMSHACEQGFLSSSPTFANAPVSPSYPSSYPSTAYYASSNASSRPATLHMAPPPPPSHSAAAAPAQYYSDPHGQYYMYPSVGVAGTGGISPSSGGFMIADQNAHMTYSTPHGQPRSPTIMMSEPYYASNDATYTNAAMAPPVPPQYQYAYSTPDTTAYQPYYGHVQQGQQTMPSPVHHHHLAMVPPSPSPPQQQQLHYLMPEPLNLHLPPQHHQMHYYERPSPPNSSHGRPSSWSRSEQAAAGPMLRSVGRSNSEPVAYTPSLSPRGRQYHSNNELRSSPSGASHSSSSSSSAKLMAPTIQKASPTAAAAAAAQSTPSGESASTSTQPQHGSRCVTP